MTATATTTAPITVVGEAATVYIGSDRYAATVVSVSPSKVIVQEDTYKAQEGSDYFGDQKYDYFSNPDGRTWTFTLRKNGAFVIKGGNLRSGIGVSVGSRETYFNPSF